MKALKPHCNWDTDMSLSCPECGYSLTSYQDGYNTCKHCGQLIFIDLDYYDVPLSECYDSGHSSND